LNVTDFKGIRAGGHFRSGQAGEITIRQPQAECAYVGPTRNLSTVKWRLWKGKTSGWSFYVGDDLFFPVRQCNYHAGNYAYASFAKEWKHGTRIGFGGYDFTRNVVANANRAGGQFTFEQRVNNRLTLATEWYTGNTAVGYVNLGAIIKVTSKLTLYTAYQIGNAGVTTGNHQFLWEIGYNFN
jgi:hypothetical protein